MNQKWDSKCLLMPIDPRILLFKKLLLEKEVWCPEHEAEPF